MGELTFTLGAWRSYLEEADWQSASLMKAGALKEEERRLKKNIIDNLENQFIDEFDKWSGRVDMFNKAIGVYNGMYKKRLRPMAYDGFCRLFIRGSKQILNEHIRMEHIVPDVDEVAALRTTMQNPDNVDDFKQKYTMLLEAKYANVKRKLAQTWDEHIFRSIVTMRYGPEHLPGMLLAKAEVMRAIE